MGTAYKPVRALDRGLDVLLALNRPAARAPPHWPGDTGIDRTTVHRLLHPLAARDLVVQATGDGSWLLRPDVRRLSDGYLPTDRLVHIAAVELGRMLSSVQWPSDFATFDRGTMTIQESTHRFSRLSIHRGMVGRRRTMLESALGRATLVRADPGTRAMMLQLVDALPGQSRTGLKRSRRWSRISAAGAMHGRSGRPIPTSARSRFRSAATGGSWAPSISSSFGASWRPEKSPSGICRISCPAPPRSKRASSPMHRTTSAGRRRLN